MFLLNIISNKQNIIINTLMIVLQHVAVIFFFMCLSISTHYKAIYSQMILYTQNRYSHIGR